MSEHPSVRLTNGRLVVRPEDERLLSPRVLVVTVAMSAVVMMHFFLWLVHVSFVREQTPTSHPQHRSVRSTPFVQHPLWLAMCKVKFWVLSHPRNPESAK